MSSRKAKREDCNKVRHGRTLGALLRDMKKGGKSEMIALFVGTKIAAKILLHHLVSSYVSLRFLSGGT